MDKLDGTACTNGIMCCKAGVLTTKTRRSGPAASRRPFI